KEKKQQKISKRQQLQQQKVMQDNADSSLVFNFPSDLLFKSQSFAAVAFLPDVDRDAQKGKKLKQPMFRVLKIYPDFETAKKDVDENLAHNVVDFHIDIVDMG